MTFLQVWVGYAIFGALIFTVMFTWAVRARQFTDMGRARQIPLDAAEPVEKADRVGGRPSRIDRWTWLGIALITVALLAYTLWVAFWGK
jgi:cbb3-type cytochrome oxidase maturation protein